jgi:hypothetical protein
VHHRTTLQGTQVTNSTGVAVFDFRRAAAVGITDIAVIDIDSGLKPKGSSAVGISSIISNSSQMTSFVDVTKSCHDFSSLGYYYCRRTCFRSVTFATSPSETESLVLRVTNLSNPSQTGDFRGFYNTETVETDGQSPEQRNKWILKYRYFVPSVPQGRYSAQFVDTRTGEVVWPTFVSTTIERQECSRYPNISPIRLEVPTPGQSQCRELVRNGRMDMSNTAYPYWLHAESGIELVRGGGLEGTNAISDIDQARSSRAYLGTFLDTRCLTLGSQYVVSAWYKLVDPTSKSLVVCDQPDGTCPSIVLRYRVPLDPRGQEFEEIPITVAFNVISKEDGWSLLQSNMTVDAALAGASSVALVVVRQRAGVKIYLDNVSMSRLE